MALLCVTLPKGVPYSQLIEDWMARKYKVANLSLDKYITVEKFQSFFPNIENVKAFLVYSHYVHGVELPNTKEILIHPDTALKYMRIIQKQKLAKLKI